MTVVYRECRSCGKLKAAEVMEDGLCPDCQEKADGDLWRLSDEAQDEWERDCA